MPHTRTFCDDAPFEFMANACIFEILPAGILTRFMGTGLVNLWQKDFTGTYLREHLEPKSSQQILDSIDTVCRHPAGLHLVGRTETSHARQIDCEAICLPLAVQGDKPPRCVRFSQPLDELKWNERKMTLDWAALPHWLDIGAGVPGNAPT